MKPAVITITWLGASALPAFAHDHPVPHTHDLPLWGLAMLGLTAGTLGTWGTLKCLAYLKEKS